MDGGTVWNINISSAINGCISLGVEDLSKITVDLFICGTEGINEGWIPGHTLDNYLRRIAITRYYNGGNAIQT